MIFCLRDLIINIINNKIQACILLLIDIKLYLDVQLNIRHMVKYYDAQKLNI